MFSGSTVTGTIEGNIDEQGQTVIKGTIKIEKKIGGMLIKPVLQAIASYTSFSYEDFLDFDPSKLRVQITETNSVTTVENLKIRFKVYSDEVLQGTQEFSVKKVSGYYVLANPNSVRDWSMNFIDIADSVEYSFVLSTRTSSATMVSVKTYEQSNLFSATSYRHVCGGGDSEVVVCDPAGTPN